MEAVQQSGMFAKTYQSGLISLLYSVGNKPLQLWNKHEEVDGTSIRRVLDDKVQSSVIALTSENISDTWLSSPPLANLGATPSLDLRLRYVVFQLRPLGDLSLEVAIKDSRDQIRRYRCSTFQKQTEIHGEMTLLPLALEEADGWNQLQLDLEQLTMQAYSTRYMCTLSVQLHANCRVRRIYFADALREESDLPPEFRLYQKLTTEELRVQKERNYV